MALYKHRSLSFMAPLKLSVGKLDLSDKHHSNEWL